MYALNGKEEYLKAQKLGLKEVKELADAGREPYPAVLDALVPEISRLSVEELPVQDIPAGRIVGTRSEGRLSAFSAGFYPLLEADSEFAMKWMKLCEAHLSDEGIREPVLCYEYLGNFYVQEGNKRVSVLKYFGAASIPAQVRRILPAPSEEAAVKAYEEFLDYYRQTRLYEPNFHRPGEYAALLGALGVSKETVWTEDERRKFLARYHTFREAFSALRGEAAGLRPEDALLLWLKVGDFTQLDTISTKELKESLASLWSDVKASARKDPIQLKTEQETDTRGTIGKLIGGTPKHLSVAMIYQADEAVSTWTRGHFEGAQQMAQTLSEAVTLRHYRGADTPERAEALLEEAVADGAELVFTTTPGLLNSTLKAAVKYPRVRFLNCSAGTSLSSVRSYYCRTYEGKFITGLIAGALADNDRIGYIGSYPIFGVPASINAFALGARMTNPRATVYLSWSCLPEDPAEALRSRNVRVISNRDIPVQDAQYMKEGRFGTFYLPEGGQPVPLASPCWLWTKMYENIVRSVLNGTWPQKKETQEAVNYWWGMDSGVIDVTMTEEVPDGVRLLAEHFMEQMRAGSFDIFRRPIISQDGSVKNDGSRSFSSLELLRMDWLCGNVVGRLPDYDELQPVSRALVKEIGVYREKITS